MFTDIHSSRPVFSTSLALLRKLRATQVNRAARYLVSRQVAKERQELASLSPEILSDIGITRDDALAEARRDFWDVEDISRSVRQ